MRICTSPTCRLGFVVALLGAASVALAVPVAPASGGDDLVQWLKLIGGPALVAGAALGTWLSGKVGARQGASEGATSAIEARFGALDERLNLQDAALLENNRDLRGVRGAIDRHAAAVAQRLVEHQDAVASRVKRHEDQEMEELRKLRGFHELLDERLDKLERRRVEQKENEESRVRHGMTEGGDGKPRA